MLIPFSKYDKNHDAVRGSHALSYAEVSNALQFHSGFYIEVLYIKHATVSPIVDIILRFYSNSQLSKLESGRIPKHHCELG